MHQIIYAARKHVKLEQMGFTEMCFQCPDIEEMIEVYVVPNEEGEENSV